MSDRKPTVLVIDDEKVIRRVTRRALEPTFLVIEAADGEQGLALLDRRPATIHRCGPGEACVVRHS